MSLNVKAIIDRELAGQKLDAKTLEAVVKGIGNLESAFVECLLELGVAAKAEFYGGRLSDESIREIVHSALDRVLEGSGQVDEKEFERMWGQVN